MRKIMGLAILGLGVVGLGWVSYSNNAVNIESSIRDGAVAAVSGTIHDVDVTVSGRDIYVSGLADTVVEHTRLMSLLHAIPGNRIVNAQQLTVLPVAAPYQFEAVKFADGMVSAQGSAPNVPARLALEADVPTAEVSLSFGAPSDWVAAVSVAMTAVAPLQTADLHIEDQNVMLRGIAQSQTELDQINLALLDMPTGYDVTTEIDLIDDGLSADYQMMFDATTGLQVKGRIPSGSSGASLGWALGLLTVMDDAQEDFAPAAIAAVDMAQNNALIAAIAAHMSDLERFDLHVEGAKPADDSNVTPIRAQLFIETRPDSDPLAVRAAILAALPDTITQSISVEAQVVGPIDGEGAVRDNQVTGKREYLIAGQWATSQSPYTFTADQVDGQSIVVLGYFPTAQLRDQLEIMVPDQSLALQPAYGAPDQWDSALIAGLAALGQTKEAQLNLEDQTLSLIGHVATPIEMSAVETMLADVPQGYTVVTDLMVDDDGLPSDFTVSYLVEQGVTIEGRLPLGLQGQDISAALRVAQVTDQSTEDHTKDGAQEQATKALAVLSALRSWLPLIEALDLEFKGVSENANASLQAQVTLTPGSDLELVKVAMSAALAVSEDTLNMRVAELQSGSATRINAATGLEEQLRNGYWLPRTDFQASLDVCTEQTAAVLQEFQIGFVSGGARLDGDAVRSVNALAAVVAPCVQAGLVAELGGHTDSTGSESFNQDLSQKRAEAVRAALITRGMAADQLRAQGYGPSQPIATNESEEGRARNRRTEIIWTAETASTQGD